MYITAGWLLTYTTLTPFSLYEARIIKYTYPFTGVVIIGLAAVGSLVLLHKSKRHLYILRAGLNPFNNIYRVLKYSWNHKVPEHRSAFTSFTTSTATNYAQSTPHEHSCCSGWYSTVSTDHQEM